LAAVTVSLELGVAFADLQQALQGFTGVDRRFSIRGTVEVEPNQPPITIIDDYGHHPAEIQATLAGAASAWPGQRILTVFQPHRYTRVRDLHTDFCRSFNDATHVVVCPIYRAGEKPIDGIDHHNLADGLTGHGHRSVAVAESLSDVVDHLSLVAQAGDIIITLGAGDVNKVCEELLTTLRADFRPAK
jgi:UDP-N-acetylmuramate--alanine ligase